MLGRVVEVASGQSLDEFVAERIFDPLGMSDTGFLVPEDERSRLTFLYAFDPETGKAVPNPDADRISSERPRFFAGGHGLVSTATDYHRFTQMMLRRGELDGVRLLSPPTVDLITSNHLPPGETLTSLGRPLGLLVSNEGRGFGFGFAPLIDPIAAKSLSSLGEYNWGGAAGTHFWVDPAEELTVVFFTQVLFGPDDPWGGAQAARLPVARRLSWIGLGARNSALVPGTVPGTAVPADPSGQHDRNAFARAGLARSRGRGTVKNLRRVWAQLPT